MSFSSGRVSMGSRENTHARSGRQIKWHSWHEAPNRRPAAAGRAGPAYAERLEPRVLLTAVWTGAASSLWSDPGNWQGGVTPFDDNIVDFPSNAANKTSTNDLGELDIASLTIRGTGYSINSTTDAGGDPSVIDFVGDGLNTDTVGASNTFNAAVDSSGLPTIFEVADQATLTFGGLL